MQHVHDMSTAYARRIVEASILVSARLEILDGAFGVLLNLLLGSEHDRLRRTGLRARRALSDGDAIRTKRALVRLVVHLGDGRNVEGASLDGVSTTDAFIVIKINDAVGILDDRARSRTSLE